MIELDSRVRLNSESPVSCDACPLASLTVYSPTVCANPTRITNLRKAVRYIAADKIVARQGEKLEVVYTIESGWAFQFITLSDGRRQILSFMVPGDIISMELLWGALALPFSIRSVTPVRLCVFEGAAFKAVLGETLAQTTTLAEDTTSYLESVFRKTTDIGRRSANGRLSQLLLELMGRANRRQVGPSEAFYFPWKQEHIADALGLTVVYVNRTLMNLRKGGVIDFDHKVMTIRDINALRSMADEG